MKDGGIGLTPAEWDVMECLWSSSPRTGREAVDYLKKEVGWSRSTTLTMLSRMTDKGMIQRAEADGVLRYSPLIERRDAVVRETDDFVRRVYKGSVGLMMNAVTQRQELSRAEIDELYEILRKAEEGVK